MNLDRDRSPRLLHFADYGASYSGSFIPMVQTIVRVGRDRGWRVELLFSELSRDQEWLAHFQRERVPYRFLEVGPRVGARRWASEFGTELTFGYWQGRLTRAIAALLAEAPGPTLLHTQFSTFDIPAAQAARSTPDARVIWHEQSALDDDWKHRFGGSARYRVFGRTVSEILCVSPSIAETIRGLRAAAPVSVLPNATDIRRYEPPSLAERASARKQLGAPSNAAVLLHFGSHWHRKGGDIFLGAVRNLVDTRPSTAWRAFTVGQEDAHAAVAAAGLGNHVAVLAPRDSVRDLYAATDVFVSCSRAEGTPFAILEALAMGVEVVASDIPGHAAVGRANSACHLTSMEADSVAAAVRRAFELDADAREGGQAAARRWVLDNASLQSWARKLDDIYQRVLPSEQFQG